MTNRIKHTLITVAVVLGLSLIVGATSNLPANAQGIVTGQNEILIGQLIDRVGERALVTAFLASGQIGSAPNPPRNNNERRRANRANTRRNERQQRTNRPVRDGNGLRLNGDLEDRLERLGPGIVYQIAVDAGLITQAEAATMLDQ